MNDQYPSSIISQRGLAAVARKPHVLGGRRKSGYAPAEPAERLTMPNKANCPRPQRRKPGAWRHAGPLRQTKPIPSGETGRPCEGDRVKQSQLHGKHSQFGGLAGRGVRPTVSNKANFERREADRAASLARSPGPKTPNKANFGRGRCQGTTRARRTNPICRNPDEC